MENLREMLSSVLSALAKGMKLSPTDLERIRAWKTELQETIRDNNDRLEEIKSELSQIEKRVLSLADECDRKTGAVKEVVAQQLEEECQELERKQGKVKVAFANLRAARNALAKIEELEEALRRGVTEEQADTLAVELEEAFDALRRADEAMDGAGKVRYQQLDSGRVDVEKHLRHIRGEAAPLSPRAAKVVEQLRAREPEET